MLYCKKHSNGLAEGCLTCAIVAKENLRGRPHRQAEHEESLERRERGAKAIETTDCEMILAQRANPADNTKETVRQMLADWNAATPEQRARALQAADKAAAHAN